MSNITTAELEKVPFLDSSDLRQRFIPTLTFYDDDEWHLWIDSAGKLLKIKGSTAEGFYFSDSPESEDDVYLHFLDFIGQRANFTSVQKAFTGLQDDFLNLAASLAKLEHYHKFREEIGHGISRVVATEIEYIFLVCRSIFDLLQEVASKIWDTVQLKDETVKKRSLPKTFSKAVHYKGEPRTTRQFEEHFGLPPTFSQFYTRNLDFFMCLRRFRDNISHHGSSIDSILSLDSGFAIRDTLQPFASFGIWTEEHKSPNNLASLRPAIGHVIHQTLVVCEDFSRTLEETIQCPTAIAPDKHLYLRGFHTGQLLDNVSAIQECKWWNDKPQQQ